MEHFYCTVLNLWFKLSVSENSSSETDWFLITQEKYFVDRRVCPLHLYDFLLMPNESKIGFLLGIKNILKISDYTIWKLICRDCEVNRRAKVVVIRYNQC